jgi:hypothetical protein
MMPGKLRTRAHDHYENKTLILSALLAISVAACGSATDSDEDVGTTTALRAEAASSPGATWEPGQCDAVYELRAHSPAGPSTPFPIPVGGEFHPQVPIDPPWGNEKVQIVGWKPLTDNKKVLHHWILYNGMANLVGWAPGSSGANYPADVGIDMPSEPGSLRLDMHYYNLTGTQEEFDQSGVSLCVVKGAHLRPKVAAIHGGFAVFSPLMVPANTRGYALNGSCTVRASSPVTLVSLSPHAHTRARHMKAVLIKKDGSERVLHDADFSFYEQVAYPFEPAVILEDGDVMKTTCTYDNDSARNIGWGEDTDDEMCFHWGFYYPKGGFTCGPTNLFPPGVRPGTPATP